MEWPGRLPATAMTSWVGLDAGARLADRWGEPARAAEYRAAAGRIRGGLLRLLDLDRVILADERDGGLAYDTSMLFGPAWGYPPGPVLDASWDWFMGHATAHGGGVRYFEGMGYGQDLFYFTTSAAAQYAAMTGEEDAASHLMDWMLAFTNRYGLAPERVYADGSGGAEATPLSWCAAELAVTVLALERSSGLADAPVVDGVLDPAEYRTVGGSCAVDADGDGDLGASPVMLCAAVDGSNLLLGIRLAGGVADLAPADVYAVYLSGEDGLGSALTTVGGSPLTFRAAATEVPSAVARVLFEPTSGNCVAGEATDDGFDDHLCEEQAVGDLSLEARVDLPSVGLAPPVQLILVARSEGDEQLVPRHGALGSGETDTTALVTFEVDATNVILAPGESITLSGDRAELGDWVGHAIGLLDDGHHPDRIAGDDLWTTTVEISRGGHILYKYLTGLPGDASWDGVEYVGDDRLSYVEDADATGRVRILDTFGSPGGWLDDP